MAKDITYRIDADRIAWVEFDLQGKKVNVLTRPFLLALDKLLVEVKEKNPAAVIFISKKENIFIAGADINVIEKMINPKEGEEDAKMIQVIFKKIENFSVPTIAAINGFCLGGGLELTLCCKYRVASDSDKTIFGLPEMNLGVIPGAGGTQRTPHLIGIRNVLDMILSGKGIDARKAKKIGLVDKVVPSSILAEAAAQFAKKPIASKNRGLKGFLEKNFIGRKIIFRTARKTLMSKTRGNYPAPFKALEAIKLSLSADLEEGLKMEAKFFGELAVSEVCKNLISIFFETESIKKSSGVEGAEVQPLPVNKVAIAGAGVMGGGIAQLLSQNDLAVRMKDINNQALASGFKAAWKLYSNLVKRKRLNNLQARQKMQYISGTTEYTGFGNSDYVIEAVVEDLNIKKKVFAELDNVTNGKAILSTNTSSLPITELAKATKHPEKVIGLHFFNPVHRMPLVEVIVTNSTSPETIATTFALAKKLRKTPIKIKDSVGFLVNRILLPYMKEAVLILEEGGADVEELDSAMLDFGMPMGPFTLADEVGIDIGYKVAKIMYEAYGERFLPTRLLEKYYAGKRFGKKAGKGFFNYVGKKKVLDRKFLSKALSEVRSKGLKISSKKNKSELQERMLFIMINEASRCLEEGIVARPEDVDIGMLFGTGFPPYTGGLLKYADKVGIPNIVSRLNELKKSESRFEPSGLLLDMAKRGQSFYKKED